MQRIIMSSESRRRPSRSKRQARTGGNLLGTFSRKAAVATKITWDYWAYSVCGDAISDVKFRKLRTEKSWQRRKQLHCSGP